MKYSPIDSSLTNRLYEHHFLPNGKNKPPFFGVSGVDIAVAISVFPEELYQAPFSLGKCNTTLVYGLKPAVLK